MKLKKYLYLSACITLLGGFASAQKPLTSGYLGKRSYASLKLTTGITFNNPQEASTAEQYRNGEVMPVKYSLKKEVGLIYGHVISNLYSFEASYNHYNTSLDAKAYMSRRGYGTRLEEVQGNPVVSDHNIGIKLKVYSRRSGAIAPLGLYNAFQLNNHAYRVDFEEVDFVMRGSSGDLFNPELKNKVWKGTGWDFNWSIGTCRALGENVILDIGLSTGFSFYDTTINNEENSIIDLAVQNGMKEMLIRYNINRGYFAIGYLF